MKARLLASTLALGSLVLQTSWAGSSLITTQALERLADQGAYALALQLVDRNQPKLIHDVQGWWRWERQAVDVLRRLGDWDRIVNRLGAVPASVPAAVRQWVRRERAAAHLELGNGASARADLVALVWQENNLSFDREQRAEQLQRWRHMVVKSYLLDDLVRDAATAATRYHHDYQDVSPDWRALRARIWIRNGQLVNVVELTADQAVPEQQFLQLVAWARTGEVPPEDLLARSTGLLHDPTFPTGTKFSLWALLAETAERFANYKLTVAALEQGFALGHDSADRDLQLVPKADDLWRAYDKYARDAANREQLLVGKFDDWFALAETAISWEPTLSRAMYAFLARHADPPARRADAEQRLLGMLWSLDDGGEVIRRLYLESTMVEGVEFMTVVQRSYLIAVALDADRVELAQDIWSVHGLTQFELDDPYRDLYLARLLAGAGSLEAAEQFALDSLVPAPEPGTRHWRLVFQLVADLQARSAHDLAAVLLERIAEFSQGAQARQLDYALAENAFRAKDFAQAAQFYLRAADHAGSDPDWRGLCVARTIGALLTAGLVEDARRVLDRHREVLGKDVATALQVAIGSR